MPWRNTGWRGVGLVAITYIYFLIFAQFAFLKRLGILGIVDEHLKAVMAAMAAGGILLSLLSPRVARCPSPRLRLNVALIICGTAAVLTLLPLGLAASMAVSFFIGAGLGLLTVTLVTHLPCWLDRRHHLLKVGVGTGVGYFVCNLPFLFNASPQLQAIASTLLCAAAMLCASRQTPGRMEERSAPAISFSRAIICFTALVWLDSAAFFIIQNTPVLKAGTWAGTAHLWVNGGLHLIAALAGAWLLRRRGLSIALILAFLSLASACLLLLNPGGALLASIFYPIGVSVYSVGLVAYPSLLAQAPSAADRSRRAGIRAGWLYAIAGWSGSAMGIGMGQNLGRVPPIFVLVAGIVIFGPQLVGIVRRRTLEVTATLAALALAFLIDRAISPAHASGNGGSAAGRGRRVYISEGCIACHSQYVRPDTPDVLLWGPVESLDDLRRQRPPLIGNRRQGPDLANVGNRRSPLWLKAHFFNPGELSLASFMPPYAYLFQDRRGADLVAYLESLYNASPAQTAIQKAWRPSTPGDASEGAALFALHCATCHSEGGRTRRNWQAAFKRLPPDLSTGPFLHLPASDSPAGHQDRLARIVKFGLPGTDMPGHEYLSDRQVASLSRWLAQRVAQPVEQQQVSYHLWR